jgi:hypothetical protein
MPPAATVAGPLLSLSPLMTATGNGTFAIPRRVGSTARSVSSRFASGRYAHS